MAEMGAVFVPDSSPQAFKKNVYSLFSVLFNNKAILKKSEPAFQNCFDSPTGHTGNMGVSMLRFLLLLPRRFYVHYHDLFGVSN